MAPHGIYPCADDEKGGDRWVAIACRCDKEWEKLAQIIAESSAKNWAEDPRWRTTANRKQNEDELDGVIASWTSRQSRHAIAASLLAVGIPAAIVAQPEDRIDHDPDTAAWGLFPQVSHSEIGEVRVDGLPIHMAKTDWEMQRGAPCLGEHNHAVFSGLLGLSDAEIATLTEEGVL